VVKGIVFNLLEEVVSRDRGEAAWERILRAARADGAYTSLGSYPDDEFTKLVAAVSDAFGQDEEAVVRWFGREALPLLADRYPAFFEPHTSTKPFLLTLNGIIHPEVRKLYPGAGVPMFTFGEEENGALTMGYRSPRRLCFFGVGLVEGAAAHYGEEVEISQPKCMRRGDPSCELRIEFAQRGAS
jgi:Haem-NO-binding